MRERWQSHYQDAVLAIEAGDFSRAAVRFGNAIEAGCPGWEPYYGRAWASLRNGDDQTHDLAAVESDLRRALEIGGPFGADAAALLGTTLLRQQRHDEALSYLLEACGRSSQSEAVESALTECLSEILDQIERAQPDAAALDRCRPLEDLVKAADLPPALVNGLVAEILATEAFSLQALERREQAEDAFLRLANLAPGHPRLPRRPAAGKPAPRSTRREREEPTFAEVGGMDVTGTFQQKLRRIFETYFSTGDIEATRRRIEEYGQKPTRSILLFGPSGCGKTYMIRSFAGEYRRRYERELPVHTARLNEVFDRYVGESEKHLTRLFDQAIAAQPSILFFDEVDAIGGSRDNDQEWKAAQTSHLLQELDRLQTEGAFIVIFGCTNRIWAVELALLRRFDELIPVEMPNQEVRQRIFEVKIQRLAPQLRPENPALPEFAKASHGMTPGDIDKVIKKSIDTLLADAMTSAEARRLENEDVLVALREYKNPHVRSWLHSSIEGLRAAGHADMVADVERMYRPYVGDVGEVRPEATEWRYIPEEAFTEEQDHDIGRMRALRR